MSINTISHRQIACFLEVCRDFHFTKAARRLGLAQPPLSRHIRELETELGVPLFERTSRQVSLTPAGRVFLQEVYQIPTQLQRAAEAARRAAGGEESLVKIGFVGALMGEGLLGVFERFRRQHPDTQLVLEDAMPGGLLDQVGKGDLDGAFLGVKPSKLPAGVELVNWREGRVVVCISRGHGLAGRKRLRIADLVGEALVVLSAEIAPAYREFIDGVFENERPLILREAKGIDAMLGMVVAGCGVALLPERLATRAGIGAVAVPLSPMGLSLQEVFVYGRRLPETFLTVLAEA